ncbi:hypothetical protein JCM11251_003119 [Rhodosporidiobolus azoricus]
MLGLLQVAAAGAALLSVASSSRAQASAGGFALDQMDTIAIGYDPSESVTKLPLLGGTTSGGLNWIHYLALSNDATSNSYYDFAGFGATVNNSIVQAASDAPPSFADQVKTWEEYFVKPEGEETEVEWTGENSLFTIFFGINDIGFTGFQHLNASDIIPLVVESYGNLVTKLYNGGARNFLILLMPPTWRSPYIRSFGDEMHTTFVKNIAAYTSSLEALAASLPARFAGLKVATYDTKPLFHAILDDPAAFGFNAKVADSACTAYWSKWPYTEPEASLEECGAPLKEYIWMDEYHPTWTVHKLLAAGVAETLSSASTTDDKSSLRSQIASALSSVQSAAGTAPSSAASSTAADAIAVPMPTTFPLLLNASSSGGFIAAEEAVSAPSTLAIRKRFRAGSPRRGGSRVGRKGPARLPNHANGVERQHGVLVPGKRKPLSRGKWNRDLRLKAQELRRRWSGM